MSEHDDGYHDAEIARLEDDLEALKISAIERGKAINGISYVFLGAGFFFLFILFSLAFGPKP